ncbi:MAG: DoxX family protein [Polyangiaceae bacterium]
MHRNRFDGETHVNAALADAAGTTEQETNKETPQMTSSTSTEARSAAEGPSKAALWGGRVLSGLAVLFMAMDASMKLLQVPDAVEGTTKLGYPASVLFGLGVVQAVCLVAYLVPRTAIVGAILWTGYLGGAVATHVRLGNPLLSHVLFPLYVAAFFWGGLWLRDMKLRALVPWRR